MFLNYFKSISKVFLIPIFFLKFVICNTPPPFQPYPNCYIKFIHLTAFQMGVAKPCTHLQVHPPPPSPIYLHLGSSTSTQFISAFTQLFAILSMLEERKYRTQLGNFPKLRPKNSKLFVFIKNWRTWYFGGADSESGLRFSKFRPQNQFWCKFEPKSQSCPFCLNIGKRGISRILILITILAF